MIGIQQEKNIPQNLFIIQMSGLHLYIGKLRLLSWLLPDLVYLSAGIPGGTTSNQTIYDLCLCCWDEVPFRVSGVVILHNFRIWGNKNPHVICELVRDSAKLSVWCDLMHGRVIRFFFFAEPTMTIGQPWHAGTPCSSPVTMWNSCTTRWCVSSLQPHHEEAP